MRNLRTTFLLCTSLALLLPACGLIGGDDDDDEPPPPPQTATAPEDEAPAGQTIITVTANSTPAGAQVVGGGRNLGNTPLTSQVPIPTPGPGQPMPTFAFIFTLDGYQPATINAAPVNGAISLTAALAPAVPPTEVGGDDSNGSGGGGGGSDSNEVRVSGRGGGPIWDNHTTTGSARVSESCVIERLRVRLVGNHTYYGDLHIALRDPQGRSYSLARGGRRDPFRTHTVRRAAGRQARGTWRLSIADRLAQDERMGQPACAREAARVTGQPERDGGEKMRPDRAEPAHLQRRGPRDGGLEVRHVALQAGGRRIGVMGGAVAAHAVWGSSRTSTDFEAGVSLCAPTASWGTRTFISG